MDALTHTILAVACMAGAYYGGRALQVRAARRMWGHIATPEMKREIQLMDALIRHMSELDDQHIRDQEPSATRHIRDQEPSATRHIRDHEPSATQGSSATQLELFAEYGRYGYSPAE